MTEPAPAAPASPARYTVEEYFALVDQGVLEPDDRVELLEGVVVAMAPENLWHANGVRLVARALTKAVGTRGYVDQQHCFIAGATSAPEPDVAVLPGELEDYFTHHPSAAMLLVEVADSSLVQDRLTKSGIYAAAGIPEYWIVSRRGDHVQVSTNPVAAERRYGTLRIARRGERIALAALPDVSVAVDELLPPAAPDAF
jgi:Uma2 family endonuclease